MGSPWAAWDSMPPLVDANGMSSQVPRTIPPPLGATVMPNGPAPRSAPASTPQYPWGISLPHSSYTFPTPQDPYAALRQWNDTTAYPQQSAPSPYIPRQPMHPEPQSHDHPRRTHSLPSPNPQPRTHKKSNSVHIHVPWPSQGDLSPLDLPTRVPDVQSFTPRALDMYNVQSFTPRALDMHTPTSSFSHSISSGSSIPPRMFHERPQEWRQDFKFKSGFASMFRSKSNIARGLDGVVDSAKLDLHPYLRYSKSRPMTIYDLRREPLTLMFRELDRPPLANDMDHSVTRPITQYMRIYHPRLPWYIHIKANGAPYISLADFFQQLFAALNKAISKYDFYNKELDEEDREILTRAYLERCYSEEDKMEGVKRVDFLRGRFEWMGLVPGKNGMWRLKTG